ncbi:MipA/OmpV family protein [Sphingomonas japonica]|uniref:Outer membrane protein n=1 Tax=Sphingomonas japonica TaxID=511662 RepID=A0ABX0U1U2_9SPHN|nr:MipA/OmpV family protein [Sphingomonas japonica]NIJ23674.1 outer membrane protein [Sphingomonas japonica]
MLPALALALLVAPAAVQAQDTVPDEPLRWRVGLGPQLVPSYPGASGVSLRPFIDVSRARGDDVFAFEAPDESAGFPVWNRGGFAVGPAIGFEGERSTGEIDVAVPEVGFTVEVGGFAQYQLLPALRLRGEVRKGLGGHKGWIANIGADYILRDGDKWLVAAGPRLTLTDRRYQRAYFGVTPDVATATGVAAYDPDGGVQAVGANIGVLRQLTPRWGVSGYAKYDRLIADAGRSPLVRDYGSRDQLSGGVALTYSFGGR